MVAQCFVVFQIADGPHEDVDAILTKKRLPIARFFSKLMGDFAKGAFYSGAVSQEGKDS